MRERGNSKARAFFEKCVPTFIYRPQQNDCMWVAVRTLQNIVHGNMENTTRSLKILGGGCMFLFLEFLKISGSVQSTKEENSLAKVTTSNFTAQVFMLNYSIYSIIHAYFCLQCNLIALCSLHCLLIQTCLRWHCGKKAKATSSFSKGGFFCPGKTSPSDTSLREMWVVLLTCCGSLSA